jgi:hypothetical protein
MTKHSVGKIPCFLMLRQVVLITSTCFRSLSLVFLKPVCRIKIGTLCKIGRIYVIRILDPLLEAPFTTLQDCNEVQCRVMWGCAFAACLILCGQVCVCDEWTPSYEK